MSEDNPDRINECELDEDALEGFIAAIDKSLYDLYGPDHQDILSSSGTIISSFEWREVYGPRQPDKPD